MNFVEAREETTNIKLYFSLVCFLLSILLQCWGMPKDDDDQLMSLMMKQVQLLVPKDRSSFVDLCVSKGDKCTENQFVGPDALFSWRPGVGNTAQRRFWGTYECVYKKVLNECPGDGGWTEWSMWATCNAECEDKGWQSRTRICENPSPKFGGESCVGMTISNRSCAGSCRNNANGVDEAKEYIQQTQALSPELEDICIKKHCYYQDVLKIIKDKSKVDKYWSSIICVKYNGPCPINGGWGSWEEWATCSVVCGHGEEYRKRECNTPHPKNGGIFCVGKYYETKLCLATQCTNWDSYTDWSEFSTCSESCGMYGTKSSLRSCLREANCYIGGTLIKEQAKIIPCYGGECPQIGGWGKWGYWAACSARCGEGRRARMRLCDSPAPSNGEDCPGANIYAESCIGRFCVQISGDAFENVRRRRATMIFTASEMNYKPFFLKHESFWKINQNGTASIRRKLSARHQNVTTLKDRPKIGKYFFGFTRNVRNDTPVLVLNMDDRISSVNGTGNALVSASIRRNRKYSGDRNFTTFVLQTSRKKRGTKLMNKDHPPMIEDDDPFLLPLNPDLELLYTAWSKWSICTKTCGGGIRRRKRTCKNKRAVCRGEVWPMQFCNSDPCPVPGAWGAWMSWTPCSVTCGSGQIERYRPCNNPLPSFGGSCSGVNSESEPCSLEKCKNPGGGFMKWSLWSTCSVTCGGGTRRRTRKVVQMEFSDTILCNPFPCAVNGLWASWGGWSTCSLPCGLGATYRDRTCTDPAPTYGGDPCDGPGSEVQTCFSGPCIDEDDYGVLLRGVGYLKYAERGIFTAFMMVFMRIKITQDKGTLCHHVRGCKGAGVSDCELSIMVSMMGRNVELEVMAKSSNPEKMMSITNIQLDEWHDIYVIVTDSWAAIRLNDDVFTEKRFASRLKKGINFDAELYVGANRLKQNGIHGIVGVLRRNFKVLLLFSMKSWLGYGAPAETENVNKFQLPLTVRHPDFKGKYYSHLFFRQSTFLQVSIVFHLTGMTGLLLFNGGIETNSSVAVTVKDGALEFCLNCGEKLLCRRAYELKLGQWYILRISVNGNEEQIRMNDGDAMQIMCPVGDKYIPRSSLYVGGAGSLDWQIIMELTKNNFMFHGLIDTLIVNDLAVTYKMSSLIDTEGVVNSLGYSLADHVTEVHEHDRATITLRCGAPETSKQSHIVRIIWLHNMRRIVSGPGTEIIDSDSDNQTVSTLNLYTSHHFEGVYSCLLSSDGVLVNLHVFVVSRYPFTGGDDESLAEWIIFIILLVIMLFVCCPLVIYICTKDHPFWDKLKRKEQPDSTEQKPLIQGSETSGTTSAADSSVLNTSGTDTSRTYTSGTDTSGRSTPGTYTSGTDTSGRSTPGTTDTSGGTHTGGNTSDASNRAQVPSASQSGERSDGTSLGTYQTQPERVCIRPPGADPSVCEEFAYIGGNPTYQDNLQLTPTNSLSQATSRGKAITFADQIAIYMPPPSGQHGGPDFREASGAQCSGVNSDYPCPPYFQEWDPCSSWEVSQSNPPSQPNFIPRDVYGIQNPSVIEHVDALRNPYYLSGVFSPFNVNQNNPTTDGSTNNTNSGYFTGGTNDPWPWKEVPESEGNPMAYKEPNIPLWGSNRIFSEEDACPRDPEMHFSPRSKSARKAGETVHFDDNFTFHSEHNNGPSSNVCNIEMVNMSNFTSNSGEINNTDCSQSSEMNEDNISTSKNRESNQAFGTDQSKKRESNQAFGTDQSKKRESNQAFGTDQSKKRESNQAFGTDQSKNRESNQAFGTDQSKNRESNQAFGTDQSKNRESNQAFGTDQSKNRESNQAFGTDQSYFSCSRGLGYVQQRLRGKQEMGQSGVKNDCKVLAAAFKEQESPDKIFTEQLVSLDSDLDSESETWSAMQMFTPTTFKEQESPDKIFTEQLVSVDSDLDSESETWSAMQMFIPTTFREQESPNKIFTEQLVSVDSDLDSESETWSAMQMFTSTTFREQESPDKIFTEQLVSLDSDLDTESETWSAMQMLTPTTNAVRCFPKQHRRTKSLSKCLDTSYTASNQREDLLGGYNTSITTSSQTHSGYLDVPVLQLEETSGDSASQLGVTDNVQCFQVRGAQANARNTKQNPQ